MRVLIYAVSPPVGEAEKRRLAQELLREGGLAVSVQVLQEFYFQVTRPHRKEPLTHEQAMKFIDSIREFPVRDLTLEVFRAGVSICRRFGLSYWDGAILAAARACGCDVVYTEDLSDGHDYDGLRVINPFRELQRRP